MAASDDVYAPVLPGAGESDCERHSPMAELLSRRKRSAELDE